MEELPPGFRFHPTDEELITYYLTCKVLDFGFVAKAIVDVDLNNCEPWDIPAKASMGEREWYFFCLKERKYPTGLRTNRATIAGYWKTTGKDKEIFHCNVLVGMKKTLVFYKGRAPKGEKTNWVMHEYRGQNKFPCKPSKEEWVVCRVFKKSSDKGKKPAPNTSFSPPPLYSPCNTTASMSELGELDTSILNNLVNPSSSFNPNFQANNESNINYNNIMDHMYMHWMLARDQVPSQPINVQWPLLPFNGYNQPTNDLSNLNSYLG